MATFEHCPKCDARNETGGRATMVVVGVVVAVLIVGFMVYSSSRKSQPDNPQTLDIHKRASDSAAREGMDRAMAMVDENIRVLKTALRSRSRSPLRQMRPMLTSYKSSMKHWLNLAKSTSDKQLLAEFHEQLLRKANLYDALLRKFSERFGKRVDIPESVVRLADIRELVEQQNVRGASN